MDSTSSVSKGVFVFKNGFTVPKIQKKSRKKYPVGESKDNIYSSQLWYQSYIGLWGILENEIQNLNNQMFSNILSSLLQYVKNCYNNNVTEIPAATLLMGINMPDHSAQFSALSDVIKREITPHVATLHAQDCPNVKHLVENMVSQFVNEIPEDDDEKEHKIIRKSLCTFSLLNSWYAKKYSMETSVRNSMNKRRKSDNLQKSLIVIIPEFESFNETVLQDFILIASSYMNVLPFVIIFGVATSLAAVHKTLPYQVSSKLNMQVFSSQSSAEYLNSILNNVLLSENCPFHLGGKVFTLFTDIFLFYDFSVRGFIQNFKFAMLEHYCYGNAMALCTSLHKLNRVLANFDNEDFENVRRLMSFRKFVESKDFETRIKLLTDDEYFRKELETCVTDFHDYIYRFHAFLKCLHVLVSDLPGSPLGKQFRELYAIAVTNNVVKTSEYKHCMQLLNFLSKDELETKHSKICDILKNYAPSHKDLEQNLTQLELCFNNDAPNANLHYVEEIEKNEAILTENMNRAKLKEELLKMSKQNKPQNVYEKLREKYLNTLSSFFEQHLAVPTCKPFHEIFFFNNVASIKTRVVGSHRAAIHTALNNPQCYLQCTCCNLPNDSSILPTLPDLSTVYKLHLECGKFINMYDWLQAFVTINDPSETDEQDRTVDPKLQARFTRAAAELEFLGFIKSSKRKTDHVQRLTWGGC